MHDNEFEISPFDELRVAHDEVKRNVGPLAKRRKAADPAPRKPVPGDAVDNHHRVYEQEENCLRVLNSYPHSVTPSAHKSAFLAT